MIPSLSLRTSLFNFVQRQCDRHHIDESHGIIHAKRCVMWVDRMLDDTLSDDQKTVAVYSAALHDLCDKKYVSAFTSINELHAWLNEHAQENRSLRGEMIEAILAIIQTMSYSFLMQRRYTDGKPWFPDHGEWTCSYHIARQADVLEGYHVGRCYLYTKHAYQELEEDEVWRRVEELFQKRMYKYVSDGWITHPIALVNAILLEEEARLCFKTHVWEYKEPQ